MSCTRRVSSTLCQRSRQPFCICSTNRSIPSRSMGVATANMRRARLLLSEVSSCHWRCGAGGALAGSGNPHAEASGQLGHEAARARSLGAGDVIQAAQAGFVGPPQDLRQVAGQDWRGMPPPARRRGMSLQQRLAGPLGKTSGVRCNAPAEGVGANDQRIHALDGSLQLADQCRALRRVRGGPALAVKQPRPGKYGIARHDHQRRSPGGGQLHQPCRH